MLKAYRRAVSSTPWFTMSVLSVTTTIIGLYLLNPLTATFEVGVAWRLIDSVKIGRFEPDESAWGAMFLLLGVLMYVSLIELSQAIDAPGGALAWLVFRLSRIVWGFGASFWAGLGASFWISNPAGISPIMAIVFGSIPSAWVATRVRIAVDTARGVEDGP